LPLDVSLIPARTPLTYGYLNDLPAFYTCRVDHKGEYAAYIFWWHWPDHRKPDWEAVIVVYKGDQIHSFHTRVHWEWRSKLFDILAEDSKAIVSFAPEVHTPFNARPLGDMNRIDPLIKLDMSKEPPPEADPPTWDEVWALAGLEDLPSEALQNAFRYGLASAFLMDIVVLLVVEPLVWRRP